MPECMPDSPTSRQSSRLLESTDDTTDEAPRGAGDEAPPPLFVPQVGLCEETICRTEVLRGRVDGPARLSSTGLIRGATVRRSLSDHSRLRG